jgi:hypothetical protein
MAISRADQSDEGPIVELLVDYSGALRELGRLDEALAYARQAYAKADEVKNEVSQASTLVQLVRIYREQRDFPKATSTIAELEPILRRGFPPGHYAFASLTSERSLLAQGQGEIATALRLADQAVFMDEAAIKTGGQGAHLLPVLLVRRSAIELEAGKQIEAAADAARALNLVQGVQTNATSATIYIPFDNGVPA